MIYQIIIDIASSKQDIEKIIALRKQVFVEEQGIPLELEIDGKDDSSFHVKVVNKKHEIIGTGRLTLESPSHGIISRIAIRQDYRKLGIGKKIIHYLEKIARQKELNELTLKPHKYLESFYASLGYIKYGDEEQVGSYALVNMKKQLLDN